MFKQCLELKARVLHACISSNFIISLHQNHYNVAVTETVVFCHGRHKRYYMIRLATKLRLRLQLDQTAWT